MALQSSGQLKLSEINTELGRTSTTEISLSSAAGGSYGTINTTSASFPDNVVSHAVSEWYSYDHTAAAANLYYGLRTSGAGSVFDGGGSSISSASSTDFSASMWIKPNWGASDTNFALMEIAPDGSSSNNNKITIFYDYGFNRIIFRYRSNSSNFDVNYSLDTAGNPSGVGSGKWHSGNRGNVNSDGFAHISVCYDASQTNSTNAMRVYWNGVSFSNPVTTNSNSRASFNKGAIHLGRTVVGTAVRNHGMDAVAFFNNRCINATESLELYNSGTPASAADCMTSTTGLVFETNFENTTITDQQGNFSLVSQSHTRTAY